MNSPITTKLPRSPRIVATPRDRRRLPPWFAGLLLVCGVIPAGAADRFSYDTVVDKARRLAQSPYQEPAKVPDFLRELDYDAHRALRFDPQQSPWPGHNFRIQFFAPGFLHQETVAINLVEANGVREAPFSPGMFDYGDRPGLEEKMPEDLGFAGFRLHYTADSPPERANSTHDEFLVFLGASYYRLKGLHQEYGLSARGAAVDTGLNVAEEFPRFREFWLERPAPDAHAMTVYALLDSHALTGAYRFTAYPGRSGSVVEVKATLFMRHNVSKLGLAPLTSMYLYGVGDHKLPRFAFPAIHDSDGLLVRTASEQWIWRPLVNPEKLQVSKLDVESIQGIGLMQRNRNPRHFDPGLDYARRPSAWITRLSAWGKGHLELIEIPTPDETNDNIVAFWVPEEPPAPGEAHELGYRIHWQMDEPVRSPYGRVVATRIGGGEADRSRKYVVDFRGGPLADLGQDAAVTSTVEIGDAELLEQRVEWDPYGEIWRLVLQAVPKDENALPTLRAHLVHEGDQVTEIWDYRMQPQGR